MSTQDYARWFRGSTPYISAHRDKTFVVLLGGEAVQHSNLNNIVHDLALLHVLGVRLVIVHGARPQIEQQLPNMLFYNGRRITDEDSITTISGIYGQIRSRIESLFSTGLPNSPMHELDIPVISGNFVVAQPAGVLDGIDHLFTGLVRRIETSRVKTTLHNNAIVLQSPIGYSPSGQMFNLSAEELAADIAIQIGADKLITFDEVSHLTDEQGRRISTLSTQAVSQLTQDQEDSVLNLRLKQLVRAVNKGVAKSQLVSFVEDGALLQELFTAEGCGTQIVQHIERAIRPASHEDVAGIVELIRPLEEAGVLVRRERDRLEQEIKQFMVAEIDGIVVGCCAIYHYGKQAELACVAVHEHYRSQQQAGLGASLLQAAEQQAKKSGVVELFALTTQTRDWFIENGFSEATTDALPEQKQSLYNWQRNAQVVIKTL